MPVARSNVAGPPYALGRHPDRLLGCRPAFECPRLGVAIHGVGRESLKGDDSASARWARGRSWLEASFNPTTDCVWTRGAGCEHGHRSAFEVHDSPQWSRVIRRVVVSLHQVVPTASPYIPNPSSVHTFAVESFYARASTPSPPSSCPRGPRPSRMSRVHCFMGPFRPSSTQLEPYRGHTNRPSELAVPLHRLPGG